jgi:hypothetical protein
MRVDPFDDLVRTRSATHACGFKVDSIGNADRKTGSEQHIERVRQH